MPDSARPSLYEVLGVASDSSQPDLARAYRRRAREVHPDAAATGASDESFGALTAAYRLLSDPTRRAAYDATLGDPHERTTPRAIPVPVHRVPSAGSSALLRPLSNRDRRPPIAAGPTYVLPNDPEATQ